MISTTPIDLNSIKLIQIKKGLSKKEVATRKAQYGLNKLPEKGGRKPIAIFLAQFKSPLIYIISIAAIISILLSQFEDAIIIGVVIGLDTIIGFFQEYRAENTMQTLRCLLKPIAHVIREGKISVIEVSEIVPDDIVVINSGDKIPADGIVIEGVTLSINEAILTGESEPVIKTHNDTIFMGTTVMSGRGLIQVTLTGINTQLGKIAESLSTIKDELTPLQQRLEKFGQTLTFMVVGISLFIFITGITLQFEILPMIQLAIVLAIAAIPEGLLIAVTMILAIGMRSILRRKGLVKKLLAVETLGSVTTICTDKTGTLTEGIMKVQRTDFRENLMASYVMALCNNLANSVEITLWDFLKSQNVNPQTLVDSNKRLFEIPFSSENKYMLTTHLINNKETSLLKGAPDIVMEFCKLNSEEKSTLTKKFEEWAGMGLKLLAIASKSEGNIRELNNFNWIGLIGIEDPIRTTVKDAIILCRRSGIKIKMITGDYRKTAEKVAAKLGLAIGTGSTLEGKEMDKMNEEELQRVVRETVIFCRVTPQHKMRIVTALQRIGEITAMIGDGVNDAPALKKANIGVSVGNATDVAQETASVILLDNNFGTLVNAVEEGRVIYDNIKKVVAYVLSNSFAEILVIFFAFLLRWPSPITVAQILWIHIICDGPSDICLGFEKGEKGIMDQPPKKINEDILDKKCKFLIVAISFSSAFLCLLLFYRFYFIGDEYSMHFANTIIFTVLGTQELVYIFSYRSLNQSLFKSGNFLQNKPLIFSVVLGFAMILSALYIPALNVLLNVIPLDYIGWSYVLSITFLMLGIVEFVKWIDNRMRISPVQHIMKILQDAQQKMPEIANLHNIAVDILKDKTLVQFHFDISGETPLKAAHLVATNIEQKIIKEFPLGQRKNLEIISHIEPARPSPGKIHSHPLRPIPKITKEIINATIKEVPEIKGYRNLNVLQEEGVHAISMIILLDSDMNITQAHIITEEIEMHLRTKMPFLKRIVIHAEPMEEKIK